MKKYPITFADFLIMENMNNKQIHKYSVIESDYEYTKTWIVFASSDEEAKQYVLDDNKHLSKYDLSCSVKQYDIRGTKFKGIIKKYEKYHM